MAWVEKLRAMQDGYTGNIAALILVGTLIAANYRKKNERQQEYRMLMYLIGNIGCYSLAEMLSDILDGVQGAGMTACLYLLNSALFFLNMLLALGWVYFIALHLGYSIPKRTKVILFGFLALGVLILTANLFTPLVFELKDNVYYEISTWYVVFLLIAAGYFVYSIFIYLVCKRNGGVLKYFPIWMYIGPSILGILLEWWSGNSLIGICNAIAFSSVFSSMQREEVFRDRLTGLYNRAYLEELKEKLEKNRNPYVSGIMLDLNGFKNINDSFGHAEGDQALIAAAELIRKTTGSYGDVIRYAGDEFVIILNTCDEARLKNCVERIQKAFQTFNRESRKPYQLSASAGYANFNAETQTVNEFLNMIDKNMYENKRDYYRNHANNRRRG